MCDSQVFARAEDVRGVYSEFDWPWEQRNWGGPEAPRGPRSIPVGEGVGS